MPKQLLGNDVSSSSNKEHSEENDSRIIGPTLPPNLLNKADNENISSSDDTQGDNSTPSSLLSNRPDSSSGNSLGAQSTVIAGPIGPALPPHLLIKPDSTSNNSAQLIGPAMSSNLSNKADSSTTNSAIIGPALPPHLLSKANLQNEDSDTAESDSSTGINEEEKIVAAAAELPDSSSGSYGPALPPHLQKISEERSDSDFDYDDDDEDEDDDEGAYGPLPPGASTSSYVHKALEERALQIKLGYVDTNETKSTVREEWMMELPQVRAGNLGLGQRQFRKNERPDFSDRSSWTDTPELKKKRALGAPVEKVDLKKEAELREIMKHDVEQSKLVEKHNKKKKRDKSLLDMHQDELKKKKKQDEKDGTVTRRPFNREIDLKVNQFDEAQKRSIMKKAMHLDDRFSRGQSKFL